MSEAEIESALIGVVNGLLTRPPNDWQTANVLRTVRDQLSMRRKSDERTLLKLWHNLFASGRLCWGCDVSNPGSPWFFCTTSSGHL